MPATSPDTRQHRPTADRCRDNSGTRAVCWIGECDLQADAEPDSGCVTQMLFGETCTIEERRDERARVCLHADGYAGWIDQSALVMETNDHPAAHFSRAASLDFSAGAPQGQAIHIPAYRVAVRSTLLFTHADLKSRVVLQLPLNARLRVDGDDDGPFAPVQLPDGSAPSSTAGTASLRAWIWRRHCLPSSNFLAGSLVDTARDLYAGAPYRWGGRTPAGADCSGLVQGAAAALGMSLPRDSKPQEDTIATRVDDDARRASDLVFWPGHVAILIDRETVFHATAHHLAAIDEPLRDVIKRAGKPSSIRRLTSEDDVPTQPSASS